MRCNLIKDIIPLFLLLIFSGNFSDLTACTSFIVNPKISNISVTGRSYDYHVKSEFNIHIFEPGEKITSVDKNTFWYVKYRFITVNNVINKIEIPFEGVNLAGISISGNLADAEYPTNNDGPILSTDDIIRYILAQAGTIYEVEKLFADVNISSEWNYHYMIFDQQGNSLAVEFIEHKACLYKNMTPILANNPDLEFQLNNLKIYANLRPYNEHDISPVTGNQFHGAGMHGIPGEWMSPSRFVRGFELLNYCTKYVSSAEEAVVLATKILDSVSLIKGIDLGKTKTYDPIYTQIQVIKDLVNQKIYLKEYDELSWKVVDS